MQYIGNRYFSVSGKCCADCYFGKAKRRGKDKKILHRQERAYYKTKSDEEIKEWKEYNLCQTQNF